MSETIRIVVFTDCSDVAFNEIRARILLELDRITNSKEIEIEPLVRVKEFSIINAAFLIRLMAELYQSGTVFLIIVQPLKKRVARIIGETENGIKFMSGNTGAINWLIKDFGLKSLYELKDKSWRSFGGKYVHAPTAARIAAGVSFEDIGVKMGKSFLSELDIPDGTVLHIDNFGLIKIKGNPSNYEEGEQLDVYVNGEKKIRATFANRMMDLDDNQWAVSPGGSLNFLPELGKVRANGAGELGINIGDRISFREVALG